MTRFPKVGSSYWTVSVRKTHSGVKKDDTCVTSSGYEVRHLPAYDHIKDCEMSAEVYFSSFKYIIYL